MYAVRWELRVFSGFSCVCSRPVHAGGLSDSRGKNSFLAVMVLMKSCNISPNKHDQKNQKPKYKDPPIRKFVTFLMGDF